MADNQQYGPLAPKQTSASDIRSVIANATRTTGKGGTIATKDELNQKKAVESARNAKVDTARATNATTKASKPIATSTPTTTAVKAAPTGPVASPVVSPTQLTGDVFKNPQLQPIKDIKVIGQGEHNAAPESNDDRFINQGGRAKELKTPVDIDNPLMDLYMDVKGKVQNGTLATSDVVKLKTAYPEFSNIQDDVLVSLIQDMGSMVKKNLTLNGDNLKKLKSLYPELSSAAWGFDVGGGENMYQAGGMREQMLSTAKTDLNKYGTIGAVAEGVMNPVGELTTLADMGAQQIGQFDSNNDRTKALKQELTKIVSTPELLNQYKKQYQDMINDKGAKGLASYLYTTRLEGDNTVEKLWNLVRGKSKQDLDAGFRDWLVHTVNNKVNGWIGELMGDANELVGVSGPNVAKMYANAPASAVKTATAITRAITNPVDTASGLIQLFGTEEGRAALAARYGSWDAFAKAMEQDPVGVASDALAVVEGGASATKAVTGIASKGSLAAALATETMGAARTTEGLLKLASRLEYLQGKAASASKTAGLASNLGVDLGIQGGKIIGKEFTGLIDGLRKWGESGDSMVKKVAKYSADASERGVGKILEEGKEVIKEGPINTIANKLMGSATDSDKLFKAASPNINKLANNVDYKNKRKNMDIATQAIVDAGFTPKTVSEWVKAHTQTLTKKWDEFKQLVKDKADVEVDVRDILKDVKDYIKSEREGATMLQKADLRKLEVEVNSIEQMGKVDMDFIEKRKEHYNSSWRDSDKLKVGDVYLRGIKMIGNAMRKQQDNILGKGPEQTKKLRKEIAALMDTKEDVIKADVRNMKKKSDIAGGGLIESYGRLSGLGDIVGGLLSTPVKGGEGLSQAAKGVGKLVLGKAMGKSRDVDYLTKKGFEGLSKKKAGNQKEGGLRSKFQDSKELGDLLVERDELKKELKNDKISDETKKKLEDRLDDVEYAIAQKKARSGLGDKERKLDAESKKKVIDMVQKRAKDVGFTTEVLDGMEKDTQGYTDLQKKLIALENNPGDTTAQHELFHAFFSVVDNKTKTYILDEAKKILKDSGMADKNAEEWLAESFGIYAKRKQIKLGNITAPKGFVAKVRDFFQRVYEFMQRFNGDRATINKVFDEVLGNRQMKNGIIDLSDLLGDKEVKVRNLGDNGLRKKAVYHGSHADFDKFDSSHMGEGEGAQAHGWGHYVAVDERTGRRYANLKGNYIEYNGMTKDDLYKKAGKMTPKEQVIYDVLHGFDAGNSKDIAKEIEYTKNNLMVSKKWYDEHATDGIIPKEYITELNEKIKFANELKPSDFKKANNRNLYTLDIPDPVKKDTPTGTNYLEEKELMSADATKKFIEVFGKKHPTKVEQLKANIDSNGYGRGGRVEGWEMYAYLESGLGSPKAASKFLESIGYDGIHYVGKRDGEAYVIFNDDALKIKDHLRYKKKTDSEGRELSDRQLKYFGNSKVRNDKGELVPVYHFTADNFNTVDFKKGAQNYFWFTSDKNASDRAMGVRPGMEKKRKDMYVDIKNPAGWDEYNKFGTDELKARGYDGVILKEKDGSFEGFIWDKENQVKYVDNQNPTRASKDMRFKKKIGDKDVEITPEADSPDQLIEKNADGLSVMKSFISEKQAEKALDVNKALLDKDGNPYLWTHTNKYSALPFTDFQNTKDSKYKEFANNEIAWVSNSEGMSKSYSSDETKLANTKAPRTEAEFDKYLKSLGTTDKGKSYTTEVEFNVKEGDGGYYVERLDKWDNTYDEEGFKDYAAFYGGMTRDAYDYLVNAMGGLDNAMEAFKKRMDKNNYRNVVVERKDGKIHVHTELPSKDTPVYKDKQGLYANMYAQLQGYNKYHYQGIVQDMKNPLVVDLGKYVKGEIRFGKDVSGQGRYWSDLGTAYDFIKKNSDIDLDTTAKAIKDEFKKAVDNEDKIWNWELFDEVERERPDRYREYKELEKEGKYEEARKVEDWLLNLTSGEKKIKNLTYGIVDKLTPEEAKIKIGDRTLGDIYNKSKKAYEKYKDVYDIWKEQESEYRKDYPIGGGVVGEKYTKLTKNNFMKYLRNKGFDDGAISMIMHDTQLRLDDAGWLASYDLAEMLKNKKLQTNDYVFYALRKGGYDGVIFKDIVDYGHLEDEIKGGDVVAMFNSKQFKAWDNANPTDSKYISYKKKVSLDKKSEGLQKKDSSGLLAKGRERMGDNGMRYKKGYHGSPYSFDKFDEKRIGKGEGSQVHGYGLYIAGTKDTAKKYAEMGRRDSFFKGQPISKFLKSKEGKVYTKAERDAIKQVGEYIPDYSPEEAIDQLKEDLYPARTTYEKEVIRALDRLDWKDFESGRNLYDVDIPDEVKRDTPSGTNYLDEEKLYGKKVYEKIFEEAKKSPEWKNSKGVDGYIADRLKFKGEDKMYGVWIRQALEYGFQNDKEASKFLQSLGYDGIEYTGLEDGKSYVLFKGSDIDITNHIRYKKGLTAKDQTQTPEFKKWFEGSKVVDKSGKPLVAYHGTHGDFNIFDKEKIGSNTNNEGLFGKGFYFTTDSKYGDYYKGKGWSKDRLEGKTMQVYLDIKNPFMWNDYKGPQAIEKLRKELGLPKSVLEWNSRGDNGIHVFTKPEQSRRFTEALEKAGYDGVWFKYDNGHQDEIVAFEPNQIKSATDNIGTFDKNNPDIRYKKAYHGTAADFDKFDSSHMGEGEGAQAHGWGHYVAVDKKTAEGYANMLGREKHNALAYKGEVRNPEKYQSLMVTRFDDEYQLNYGGSDIEGFKEDFPMIKERMLKGVERSRLSAVEDYNWELNDIAKRKKLGEKITPAQKEKLERLKEYVQGLDRTIKEIKDTKPEDITFKEQGGRHLYDLEIPDPKKAKTPTGSNYWEEDGKITKSQIDKIYNEVVKEFEKKKEGKAKRVQNLQDGQLRVFKNLIEQAQGMLSDGKGLYTTLSNVLGGQKEASKFLESLGYDGIHYYGGRDGEAYVIFNDDSLEIKDHLRYKKGLQKKSDGLEKKDSGIRYKLAKGAKENSLATNSERDILWSKRLLEQAAKNGGIKFTSHNGGYTIDDALETLKEINPNKDKVSTSQAIKNAKNGMIEQINKAIDDGNGGDWHYQWFFDPSSPLTPTIVYWKGNDMKKEVLAGREISFHQPRGRKFKYVPRNRNLPISPIRLKKWGKLK